MTMKILNYENIVARNWWDKHAPEYPFHVITKRDPAVNPQTIRDALNANGELRISFITTGLVGGDRIWGFKTAKDRAFTMKLINPDLVLEMN